MGKTKVLLSILLPYRPLIQDGFDLIRRQRTIHNFAHENDFSILLGQRLQYHL